MKGKDANNIDDEFTLPESVLSRITIINDIPEEQKETAPNIQSEKQESAPKIESSERPKSDLVIPNTEKETEKEPFENEKTSDKGNEAFGESHQPETEDEVRKIVLEIRQKSDEYTDKVVEIVGKNITDEKVTDAVNQYLYNQCNWALRTTPIEEINYRKVGIRVSALRNAGYQNVEDIMDDSYSQLTSIRGIGEKNARLIMEEREILWKRILSRTTINIRKDILAEVNILTEYYRFFSLSTLYGRADKMFSEVYMHMNSFLKLSKRCVKDSKWQRLSEKKKSLIFSEALYLKELLSDEMVKNINGFYDRKNAIDAAGIDSIYRVYRLNQGSFDSAFEWYRNKFISSMNSWNGYNQVRHYSKDGKKSKKRLGSLLIALLIIVIMVLFFK